MNTRRKVIYPFSRRPSLGDRKEPVVEANYRRCCGIDVHKKSVTVCVLPPGGQPHLGIKRRKFRTFTRDLKQLRAWLKNCQVTDIAMESTGQYWRSLWNLLEGEFQQLILVNPQHIKGLNGYKTDPKDAHWIAGLLESGKLRDSWVPPRAMRELRDLTRQRVNVLEDLNRVKNRTNSCARPATSKYLSVATDLFGVSGRRCSRRLWKESTMPAGWRIMRGEHCAARGRIWSGRWKAPSPTTSGGC